MNSQRRLSIFSAWWAARWKPVTVMTATVAAMLFAAINIAYYVTVAKDRAAAQAQRRVDAGLSTLDNCLQIEALKTAQREDKLAVLKQLPTLDYYKTRPAELKMANRSVRASLSRFVPNDCYQLPTVANAGIKRPKQPAAGSPPLLPPLTSRRRP